MDTEILFRGVLLAVMVGYIVPRAYYRVKGRRSGPPGEVALRNATESRLRLALMGVSGLGADSLSVLWGIRPTWLRWSSLPLPDWLRWIGVVVGVVAVWLGYLSHRTLGFNYTPTLMTKEDHQIVATGIYRRMRHPMYASFFAILTACFLLSANWLIGLLGLVYCLLIVERVRHEEHMLLDEFGEEYCRYMRRTGRFFPRLFARKEA
jgi:protein-S-isoprenylcysteine O-methyltransferase Ste14